MDDAISLIDDAWQEEGSIRRLGLLPAPDKELQKALTPGGGDWSCVAAKGAITRSVFWNATEVALINPSGDLGDGLEGQIAMAFRACPVMDKALRVIFILANKPENSDLIRRIARAAIGAVEQPAPSLTPDEEEED